MTGLSAVVDAWPNNADGVSVAQLGGIPGDSDSHVRRQLTALSAAGCGSVNRDEPKGPGRPTLGFRLASARHGWGEIAGMMTALLGGTDGIDPEAFAGMGRDRGRELVDPDVPVGSPASPGPIRTSGETAGPSARHPTGAGA
jgi:predicted ArsR family transcriptional regulator